MKLKKFAIVAMAMASAMTACTENGGNDVSVFSEGIRFCESTYPYKDGILIANFGTEELNPLNSEGKGYIVYFDGETGKIAIPADGNLSAPKGMYMKGSRLFICDVNKIAVYDMDKTSEKPVVITMPEGNLFVNDLAACGNWLYASVTNTDKIFRIDISDPANPGVPEEWFTVPGPNGLLADGRTMYVASYPADGNTTENNVIYRISDIENPILEKFTSVQGQYDGIAFSSDRKYIYITNWTPAEVAKIDITNGEISPVAIATDKPFIGPADMTVLKNRIYIPDLPNSRVVIVNE